MRHVIELVVTISTTERFTFGFLSPSDPTRDPEALVADPGSDAQIRRFGADNTPTRVHERNGIR
jgi:hypothetical protein